MPAGTGPSCHCPVRNTRSISDSNTGSPLGAAGSAAGAPAPPGAAAVRTVRAALANAAGSTSAATSVSSGAGASGSTSVPASSQRVGLGWARARMSSLWAWTAFQSSCRMPPGGDGGGRGLGEGRGRDARRPAAAGAALRERTNPSTQPPLTLPPRTRVAAVGAARRAGEGAGMVRAGARLSGLRPRAAQIKPVCAATICEPRADPRSLEAPVEGVCDVVLHHPVGQRRLPHAVGALAAPAAPLAEADRGAEPAGRWRWGGGRARGRVCRRGALEVGVAERLARAAGSCCQPSSTSSSPLPGLACLYPIPAPKSRPAHLSRFTNPKWRIQMSGMFLGNWGLGGRGGEIRQAWRGGPGRGEAEEGWGAGRGAQERPAARAQQTSKERGGGAPVAAPSRPRALAPSRPRALAPSRPRALAPSRPRALAPVRPRARAPSRPYLGV
jgi:hypothetical protein